MRRAYYALLGSIIGIASALFAPLNLKYFGFAIPAILFSIALRADGDRFNLTIFILFNITYLIIPSNLLTFDASNALNITQLVTGANTFVQNLVLALSIGPVVVLFIGGIWSFILGRTDVAAKNWFRAIIIMVSLSFVIFGLDFAGISLGGITSLVADLYVGLFEVIIGLPSYIYKGIDSFLSGTPLLGIDLPDLPETETPIDTLLVYDTARSMFDLTNPDDLVYTIYNGVPIITGFVCFAFFFIMINKSWETQLVGMINQLSGPKDDVPRKENNRITPKLDLTMIGYMLILFGCAMVIYLNYANSFGTSNVSLAEQYRYNGYFSIYLIGSLIFLLLIAIWQPPYYRKARVINTLKGTAIGVVVLFITMRLWTTDLVMDAYSVQGDIDYSVSYVWNTFIFIAPAETIFFDITIPVFIMACIGVYMKRKLVKNYNETLKNKEDVLKDKLIAREGAKDYNKTMLKANREPILIENPNARTKELKKTEKKAQLEPQQKEVASGESPAVRLTGEYGEFQERLSLVQDDVIALQRDVHELKVKEKAVISVSFEDILSKPTPLILFLVFMFIKSFFFASIHCIVPQDIDFFRFWMSGLGVIYFVGSCWFTFVAYKWGWLSAILTHAFYNTSTIIMYLILLGL